MCDVKVVFVINGKGGVGKDTLCEAVSRELSVCNVSSITPIKEIAAQCGWDGSKDDRSRKFLADLKQLCVDYNDYPTAWLRVQYEEFLASDQAVMFVHIREPEEIKKFVDATGGRAKTLLIRAEKRLSKSVYGNGADDNVENYDYDFIFDNDGDAEEMAEAFCRFIGEYIRRVIEEKRALEERGFDILTPLQREAQKRMERLEAERRKELIAREEAAKNTIIDRLPPRMPRDADKKKRKK